MFNNPYIDECLLWQENRGTAVFKSTPEDFVVNEILDWEFKGQGEHIFLQIEKTGCNTAWVSKQLGKFYGVPLLDVSYSGLKDRHAVTTQYFSVRLPGVKPESYELPEHEEFRVVSHVLHDRKLKRGNHKYNHFTIRLRDVTGDADMIEQRLQYIRENGCPNLFDKQRFGHGNNNLQRLQKWIDGEIELRKRDEKGMVLSAMRSAIFNRKLSERVKNNTWQQVIVGDTVILDGSKSQFVAEAVDDEIIQRAKDQDIHAAGQLVGSDSEFSESSETLTTLMQREHLQAANRSLRLNVKDLAWEHEGGVYTIEMRLPSGAYASGVIRQLFDI